MQYSYWKCIIHFYYAPIIFNCHKFMKYLPCKALMGFLMHIMYLSLVLFWWVTAILNFCVTCRLKKHQVLFLNLNLFNCKGWCMFILVTTRSSTLEMQCVTGESKPDTAESGFIQRPAVKSHIWRNIVFIAVMNFGFCCWAEERNSWELSVKFSLSLYINKHYHYPSVCIFV